MIQEKGTGTIFDDGDATSGTGWQEVITFKLIVLLHLKNITKYGSVEFRGGYWEEKPHPNPNFDVIIKTYIPDTREIYSNAIDCMADMLYSRFDDEMRKAEEECQKELNQLLHDKTVVKQQDRTEKNSAEDRLVEVREFQDDNTKLVYRSERVRISRKLFRALCNFLKRIDYLNSRTYIDKADVFDDDTATSPETQDEVYSAEKKPFGK